MNKNIALLNQAGQSIWYDNLSKDILQDGSLNQFIDQGISGLTSNPAIFEQAIAKTNTYHADILHLKQAGKTVEETCDRLMLNDVANAADLLLPVYQKTNGFDGYASLEVSPFLANQVAETIEAAKKFWQELSRPNIMIKIPATPAGIEAIEALIAEGININVTLIFSPAEYQKVIAAYLNGLEKALGKGLPIDRIHSVASFFISRADSWIETKTQNQPKAELIGKVGIANGIKAYQVFTENFSSARFLSLKKSGANIQRILWASTGVKNKSLSPLLYAVGLPMKDSVATHPPALVNEILSSENLLIGTNGIDANHILVKMKESNLSLQEMYDELLADGVNKFVQSFQQLLGAVAAVN